jgi:putative transposase
MSHVRILVHAVWSTYKREKILSLDIRNKLYAHIKENALIKGIPIIKIGGHDDHIHCLLSMGINFDIGKIIKLLKGESSHWANKNSLINPKLRWAEEFFAASVNESSINKVCHYINNQEEHHKKYSFQEEYSRFLKAHGYSN